MMKWIGKRYRCLISAALVIVLAISSQVTGYAEPVSGPGANITSGNSDSTNNVTIYVSKRTKMLSLKQNGVLIVEYPVSLGASSAEGNKKVEGDMRTPSGEF